MHHRNGGLPKRAFCQPHAACARTCAAHHSGHLCQAVRERPEERLTTPRLLPKPPYGQTCESSEKRRRMSLISKPTIASDRGLSLDGRRRSIRSVHSSSSKASLYDRELGHCGTRSFQSSRSVRTKYRRGSTKLRLRITSPVYPRKTTSARMYICAA
jgi:hypothetical protein